MKLKPTIAVSAEGFLFNPATGESFAANPLAAEIVRQLQQGAAPVTIKADLLARYDVAPARLDADWDDLLTQLHDFDLLEN